MLVSLREELSAHVTLYTARSFVDVGFLKKNVFQIVSCHPWWLE